ncbi:Uncharacterized protein OBRU01_22292 [Operophtera brumata]|uniref:Uncharacterized protein n=1 Tax=Operophtera brumata TaxID=104452 RepID=A0A0L7KRN2_OPEBR|nr:Uncharacterized protein OBRU01_22292 [Operophtera brumata]
MKLHVTTVHLKQPTPYKSKNRKLKEARSQGKWKVNPNPRKKIPAIIDSVEVLKNGLESYVLGPLKADLENLKADIDMLARGEFEEELTAVESIEVKDDAFEEDNEYEMKDDVYEVIEEVLYDDEDTEI